MKDASMIEEKSLITEFTQVKWAQELDICNVDKLAIETLWCIPAPHLVDSWAFGYALELLIPRNPTLSAIL